MSKTINILNPPQGVIGIGHTRENEFETLSFDVSGWLEQYPGAKIDILFRRPDGLEYSVIMDASESPVLWQPTEVDMEVEGIGKVEAQVKRGTMLGKSDIIRVKALESLGPSGEQGDWLKKLVANAKAAATHAPKIVDGTWHVWDFEQSMYVDTTVPAKGVDGLSPVKGVDYWTDNDKESMIEDMVNSTGYIGVQFLGDEMPYDCVTYGDVPSYLLCGNNAAVDMIKTLTMKGNPTQIPHSLCRWERLLKNVSFPDSIKTIRDYAFYNCSVLEGPLDLRYVTYLEYSSFNNCTSLRKVTLPLSGVFGRSNQQAAFYGCSLLRTAGPEYDDEQNDYDIIFPDGISRLAENILSGCSYLQSVTIPDTVTHIGSYAFYQCTSLPEIVIPNSVISISSYAFYQCTLLESITIPESVTTIGTTAFQNCYALRSIRLPTSLKTLGEYTFMNCTGATSLFAPGIVSITSGSNARGCFCNCTALTSIQLGSIGNTVVSMGSYTFQGCTNPDLVVTVYTVGTYASSLLTSIRNGCTKATIIIKAAESTVYNNETYAAGETMLQSTT